MGKKMRKNTLGRSASPMEKTWKKGRRKDDHGMHASDEHWKNLFHAKSPGLTNLKSDTKPAQFYEHLNVNVIRIFKQLNSFHFGHLDKKSTVLSKTERKKKLCRKLSVL